ncbi:TA system VapC family ribonuclease toxin [Aeromicrobium fastidiosum]|uniref:TA system VapC family ribonuclease toxin n=1 Tax=Aeromicrobium fastidiosum TaxID=52699 RepID=UPI00165F5CE8|nr:TA system VapC family ribonuclease toxin [Aeromicrobium fastidiosum]MBP2389515.1 toxin-antitoxin system PIN domain toxin [Aeromicrobium fastidiosum]
MDAWRPGSARHQSARQWLENASQSTELALPDAVLAGATRILTLRVRGLGFTVTSVLDEVAALLSAPGVRRVSSGPRHWAIFDSLCRELGATGNTIPDCYLAALAIERKATFVSRDRFFSTVPGLDWIDLPPTS